nr:hypothetical protein [Rhodococcus rhodnii]
MTSSTSWADRGPDDNGPSEPPYDTRRGRGSSATTALVAAIVAAVVALGAAGWFGYGWIHALVVDKGTADVRDDALAGAQQAAINLNTVDSGDFEASFENMRSSIVGDEMNRDLDATEAGITDELRQQGGTSTAEVVGSTLTELDTDGRTATALVVIEQTMTWPEQYRASRITMRLGVQEDGGTWKAASVEPIGVPVDLGSGPIPGSEPAPEGEAQPEQPDGEQQPEPAPAPGG